MKDIEKKKRVRAKWREKNPNYFKDYAKTPKRIEYMKKWKQKYKLRKGKQRDDNIHSWGRKVRILKQVANGKDICCIGCGVKDPRLLQIHHVNGDGTRDPRFIRDFFSKRGNNTYLHKGIDVSGLELRCANCNLLAEYESGRRYPWLSGFDENFNPIWRGLPDEN